MKRSSSCPAALTWLFGGVLLATFLYLIVGVGRVGTEAPGHDAMAVCIEKYKVQTAVTTVNVGTLYDLNLFCYNNIGSQLKLDQEKIRRDSFVFQRNENVVLLFMVVLITISGVVLAGVQLLASYKLALLGRGALAGGGSEISYSATSVSFKSSVIELTILAMSFAFFLVFVIYVFDMADVSSDPGAARTTIPARQVPNQPMPDQRRAPEAPSAAVGPLSGAATAEQR